MTARQIPVEPAFWIVGATYEALQAGAAEPQADEAVLAIGALECPVETAFLATDKSSNVVALQADYAVLAIRTLVRVLVQHLIKDKTFLHSLPYAFSEFRMDKERMQFVPRVSVEEFQRSVPRVNPIGLALVCQRRAVPIFSIILIGGDAETPSIGNSCA